MKIRFLISALAISALFGCNGGSGGQVATEKPGGKHLKIGIVFDSGGKGDKSFNDSADEGTKRAVNDLGIAAEDIKSVDSKSEKDYEGNISALAEGGCDIVFAVGLAQNNALTKVAPKYKDVKFAIIDSVVDQPNVRSLVFNEEQGSFLAGYLAALMSKSNKIGFVGGKKIPLISKFESGYIAGAKSAKADIQILPSKYTDSWDDTALGKAAASTLFNDGADVVYHASGRCGIGVITAAKEAGKYAIGVDSDQDGLQPGSVLTSMIKRVDESVFQTIKDVQDGKFTAGTKVYDLKAKGVGLSSFTYTKDKIGSENLKKVSEIEAKIVSGEIKVPSTPEELTEFLSKAKK